MAVMDAPRTRRTDHARSDAWPEDAAIEELEEIFWSLGEFPGHRTELLEGRIVVSPVAVYWHSQVTLWLYEQFREACQANGWGQSLASDLVLPPTRDIVEPDHLIISDPAKFSDLRSDVPVEQALLVSEVVSPSSVRDDREVKPARYAKAKIPFYLLIDRLTEPSAITLFSEPGDSGYTKSDTAHVGPRGRRLIVPAPVEVTLDPMTMPIPRG